MNDLKEVLRALREERYATAEVMLTKILDREWAETTLYTKPDTKTEVLHKTESDAKCNFVKTYCGGKPNYCTDAVNMSQECVDETAKGGHEWVGLTKEENT